MGLLTYLKQWLGDEKKKDSLGRVRGPTRTQAEREIAQRMREMNYLKKQDPDGYLEVIRNRYARRDSQNPITMLKEMAEIQRLAKRSGMMGDSGGDSLDRLVEKLPELMIALGPTIGAIATGQAPIVHHSPQIEAPKRRPKRVETPQEDTPAETVEPVEEVEEEEKPVPKVTPEMAAAFARMNLENMNPRNAAGWLLAQNHPAVDGMVKVILDTPDDRLFAVLKTHAQSTNEPALVDLMAWFESRGQWTLDIAGFIRRARQPKASRGKLKVL